MLLKVIKVTKVKLILVMFYLTQYIPPDILLNCNSIKIEMFYILFFFYEIDTLFLEASVSFTLTTYNKHY